MVIYPIIGSVHISFHDWNGTQFKCSDGRDIKSLQENEFCRKIPNMKYVGFENYERFFKKTPKDFNKIIKDNKHLMSEYQNLKCILYHRS